MTAVISGTNGLLQSYDYQTPTTGFSYTFAAGTQVLVMNPAGTLATGTITMPAAPADGMTITFSSSQQITALTMSGNGANISSAVTFLPAKGAAAYIYRLANTTWYPTVIVPGTGSQLVSGTSVASTSGTSIDFTSIPSWVKRVTILLNGVSQNIVGGQVLLVQIGSGSVDTTGYASGVGYTGAGTGGTTSTAGFVAANSFAGTNIANGAITLFTLGSNIWVASVCLGFSDSAFGYVGGGTKTLSGALDRVRITTAGGTATFDAGSINILYE